MAPNNSAIIVHQWSPNSPRPALPMNWPAAALKPKATAGRTTKMGSLKTELHRLLDGTSVGEVRRSIWALPQRRMSSTSGNKDCP